MAAAGEPSLEVLTDGPNLVWLHRRVGHNGSGGLLVQSTRGPVRCEANQKPAMGPFILAGREPASTKLKQCRRCHAVLPAGSREWVIFRQ